MKFKKGDILVKNPDSKVWFKNIYNCKIIKIKDIKQIDGLCYYTLYTIPEIKNGIETDYLFKQVQIDSMYDLDITKERINKILKLINGIQKR